MVKGDVRNIIEEKEIATLNQLVKNLEDSFEKLNKAYEKKDAEGFNRLRGEVIQTQRMISEVVR